jgi:hypothetical protein
MKKEHPHATRGGARSLLTMGFTRQALGTASHTAQDDVDYGDGDGNGDVDSDGDVVMASGGLENIPAASSLVQSSIGTQLTTAIDESGTSRQ